MVGRKKAFKERNVITLPGLQFLRPFSVGPITALQPLIGWSNKSHVFSGAQIQQQFFQAEILPNWVQ